MVDWRLRVTCGLVVLNRAPRKTNTLRATMMTQMTVRKGPRMVLCVLLPWLWNSKLTPKMSRWLRNDSLNVFLVVSVWSCFIIFEIF